jgi:hypothetical protein
LKFSLRNLCGLCVSAVIGLEKKHRGDAENAEVTQRVETAPVSESAWSCIGPKKEI